MARSETLLGLRTQIRSRGEFRPTYISDSELTTMINQSIAELYDLLVSVNQDYYLSSADLAVVAGTAAYALPATFYKAFGVDYVRPDGTLCPLAKFMWPERGSLVRAASAELTRYRVMGDNLRLEPVPGWSGTVRFWYIPAPTKLTADGQTFDGIAGWEEYVVLDCCIKCAAKEESDASVFMAQKAAQAERIRSLGSERDYHEADRVVDVQTTARGSYWAP